MGIQQCQGCNKKLDWFSIVKSIWLGYKPIKCSGCGKQYVIDFKTRYKTTFSMIIPLFLFGIILRNTMTLSTGFMIGALFLFGSLITFILPFFIRYSLDPLKKQ
ncbi:TIGR04104 family putative zinc finger protein [Ureibacillus acetophenoni]|uniref:CXXC-20-CXXC protein n=1 Tax=Ureibacillus acetophenoni TaxID=614649 RepID=A0A285URF6_9BACL|nr:TIGR04104 family putative zinc finger protein [Ureibacillus acetophenoni]SOC44409.1 CXXC-20-CXXC protein [Ureibacillus acetophenoni]